MYTPTPLTIAESLVEGEPSRDYVLKKTLSHADLVRQHDDAIAQTTTYIFKDGSKLLFEPHTYEITP